MMKLRVSSEIIKREEIINQLISDIEYFNQKAIQMVINNVEEQTFLDEYKIKAELSTFFNGCCFWSS